MHVEVKSEPPPTVIGGKSCVEIALHELTSEESICFWTFSPTRAFTSTALGLPRRLRIVSFGVSIWS
jgi:hypothetical protein